MKSKVSSSKSSKGGLAKKVGDKIERVGERLTKAGASKLGRSVYKAGDKIEHLADKKLSGRRENNQRNGGRTTSSRPTSH